MGLFGNWQGSESDEGDDGGLAEINGLRQAVRGAKMPARVEKVALKEIDRLLKTNSAATEYTIGINYIEYLTSLPWNFTTDDNLDLAHAKHILDAEHYGLENIKERILEYLAVRKLKLACRHKVLVVDDEKVARRNMKHVLAKDGYEVTSVAGGAEALLLLESQRFDLIVTDLKMAGVDGMQLLEKAKAADPGVEVIMVSGFATTPAAVEAMKKGSYYFLTKPFQLDELRDMVRKALKQKEMRVGGKGPILCFVGPPGTGKTSLQQSIAHCLGRKFIRISLAGMKDEAEIRGHRRSYVGALPGRIIQEIRRTGSKNPLVMLDEIDKIGQDFKGDPASALLEVLDHTQNSHFIDHYLDVPFDLSQVMFIATANTTDPIPAPLVDRMEVISLSGYAEEEKEQIAERFLIPRAVEETGLASNPPQFTPEAILKIIRDYTRESGLRGLQGQFAAICRKLARKVVNNSAENDLIITPEKVEELLGPRRYFFEVAEVRQMIGVATGLALTEAGGQIIFVEALIMKGKEQLIMTGSLGGVMKESAQAALSYVRSQAKSFHIADDFFEGHDIHIHIPAGAIPKDGPSAGLTIAVSLISLLTRRPVQLDMAFTGELTLCGRILPVGGIKEKILAARRAGITKIVLPLRNKVDLYDIPANVTQDIEIVVTDEINKVIELALGPPVL
ncbi:MAG: endopeptidase La [Proteobacteria bacterium]|nr:endopeptidase La [Pseudomonadota bacterium]MBU1641235.1 endopeptidase La [Pseudomonadota bacterium]